MKNPEYVALVTGVYRAALDRAAADPGELRGPRRRAGRALGVLLPGLHRGVPARRARQRDDELPAPQQPGCVRRPCRVCRERARPPSRWSPSSMPRTPSSSGRRRAASRRRPASCRSTARTTRPRLPASEPLSRPSAARSPETASSACATPLSAAAARRTFERPDEAPASHSVSPFACVVGEPLHVEVEDDWRAHGHCRWAGSGARTHEGRHRRGDRRAHRSSRRHALSHRGVRSRPLAGAGVGFSALHRLRREALDAYEAHVARAVGRTRAHAARTADALPGVRRGLIALTWWSMRRVSSVALACLDAGADRAHVPSHALTLGDVPREVSCRSSRECCTTERWRLLCASPRMTQTVVVGNLGLVGPAATRGSGRRGPLVAQCAERIRRGATRGTRSGSACGCPRAVGAADRRDLRGDADSARDIGVGPPRGDGDRALRSHGTGGVRSAMRCLRAPGRRQQAARPEGLRVPRADRRHRAHATCSTRFGSI